MLARRPLACCAVRRQRLSDHDSTWTTALCTCGRAAAIYPDAPFTPALSWFSRLSALRDGRVMAHLSGHYHGLLAAITHPWFGEVLHGRHGGGTLELEVADFVHRGRYRVAAFDHDVFSFVDVKAGEWPVILVTNPKVRWCSKRMRQESMLTSCTRNAGRWVSVSV